MHFVYFALVKELKMAKTLRAQGPPQVRLLMATDFFASVSRDTFFPFREPSNIFYWGFFPSGPLLLLALLLCLPWPGFALLPARPGRPGFRSVPVRSLGCSVFALLGLALSRLRFSSFLEFLARHMGVDE